MPGPRPKPTFAAAVRETVDDIPGNLAVQYVCDGLRKCIDDPGLSWPVAITAVVTAAGVVNPVSVAGLVGLGVAIGVTRLRNKHQQARQVEANLRAQAAAGQTMHDILLNLKDRTLTVGLDNLALNDIRELVTEALQNHAAQLNDKLEAAFNTALDELPPGPLRDELDNLRILADDTNKTAHQNAAGIATTNTGINEIMNQLAELKQHILATSPASKESPGDTPSNDNTLDSALLRLAHDAERGVDTARKAIEDKSPQEAGDYFVEKLATLDRSRAAIEKRMDQDEIQISREAAELLFRTGRIEETKQAIHRILAHLPDDLDATNRLGHIHHLRGNLPAAKRQYERLLELAPSDQAWRATALGNLGLIAQTRGELDKAEKLHRESLDINRKLGRLAGQANQLGNLGLIALTRGELDEAEKLHREALDINRKLGRLEGQASDLGNFGIIAQTLGDLDEAEKLFRESLDIERKLGRLEGQASDLGNLAVIVRKRGDLYEAEKLHHESLDIERKLGRLEGQANQLGNLGLIARKRGNLDEAEKLLRESLDINRSLGRLEGQANQLGNLGFIAIARGKLGEARKLWNESRDLFGRIGMPHMVEKVQGWLDRLPSS